MKKLLLFISIVACISLVGCGKEESKQNVEENKESVETQAKVEEKSSEESMSTDELVDELKDLAPDQYESAKEAVENVEVKSNNSTISFMIADTSEAIYYHDGEKITGYEIHIKYDTSEEANLAKTSYDLGEEDEGIESVTVKGNTLIVKYNPSSYEDTSLEEIKQTASLINSLQNN